MWPAFCQARLPEDELVSTRKFLVPEIYPCFALAIRSRQTRDEHELSGRFLWLENAIYLRVDVVNERSLFKARFGNPGSDNWKKI